MRPAGRAREEPGGGHVRAGLAAVWLAGLALLGTTLGARPAAGGGKPNILFILADDLGWGDLSCYGNRFLRTPNLDRLAAEGTLFTQFYTAGSVCSPSRSAFMTGRYPARHRIHGHYATPEQNAARGMGNWLDPAVPNCASVLKKGGYTTAHIGKWHLGSGPGAPEIGAYGFDFVGTGERGGANVDRADPYFRAKSTEIFVDEALKFIDGREGKPFYLQLWTLVPHATLNPTPEQMRPFERFGPASTQHKGARTIYYATVAELDRQIGRLLDGLEQRGLARDTLVLFSSDNGPEDIFIANAGHSGVGSPGPFRGRKRSLYEGGVRVPFIARWPGRVPVRVDDDSVLGGVDLLPTLCAVAGIPAPREPERDGESVADVLQGRSRERKAPLFWEWRFRIAGHPSSVSPQLAIREGRWKLLMNPDGSRVELYDIPADSMQIGNAAERHPETVSRLRKKLLAWKATLPEGPTDPGAGDDRYPWPGRLRPGQPASPPSRR